MDIEKIKPCFIMEKLEYKNSKYTIKSINIYSEYPDNYTLTSCDLFMGTGITQY